MSAAAAEGADPERARADAEGMIRRELERSVIDDPDAVTHERLWSLADGEMGGVLRARTRVVGSLITAIDERVAAVAPGTSVRVIDGSGAELGYATGRPQTADPATSIGWLASTR